MTEGNWTKSDIHYSANRVLGEQWWKNYYAVERERLTRKIIHTDPNDHDALRWPVTRLQALEHLAQDLRKAARTE